MTDFLQDHYLLLKFLHIISFIAWLAGLFYLPRLFVYHHRFSPGSKAYETFVVMERRLLKIIMTPAMVTTFLSGVGLLVSVDCFSEGWFHVKLMVVFLLAGFQGFLSRWLKDFSKGSPPHSERFFRYINEVPTIFLVIIVFLVVFKPF